MTQNVCLNHPRLIKTTVTMFVSKVEASAQSRSRRKASASALLSNTASETDPRGRSLFKTLSSAANYTSSALNVRPSTEFSDHIMAHALNVL